MIFAAVDATTVIAAGIGGACATLATTIPSYLSYRSNKETRRIVTGNGKGSVDIMLAKVLDQQDEAVTALRLHEAKLDGVLFWQGTHDASHVRDRAYGATALVTEATKELVQEIHDVVDPEHHHQEPS